METIQETVNSLPQTPGVYIYKNSTGVIIYIGKAINLSKRVKQYFQRDDAVGEKTPQLVSEIVSIDTIETQHEFDALLLEAKLIKQYQPKYNVIAKDDKSPLYIIITIDEELPRIQFGRKPKNNTNVSSSHLYFGPFQSGKVAKNLMRSLRHVIPYCTQTIRNGKKCFYTHLGLCHPCPSYIAKVKDPIEKKRLTKTYRKHIFRIRDILSGKAVSVVTDMERDMHILANSEHFEEAASLRNQLTALRSLLSKKYDPSIYLQSDTLVQEIFQSERNDLINALQPYYPALQSLSRIECYDISNIMGTFATASMVVMTDGQIDKSQYRKFRMRTNKVPNDFAMMAEVIERRLRHPEWKFPNLIVIDGGKGQVSSAQKVLQRIMIDNVHNGSIIPIIGLAKREEEIIIPTNDSWKILRLSFSNGGLKLLQRLRDEAHRFAITYHKILRKKESIS